ncbi:MAG TPA: hypothetical protein VGQ14_00665 [Candidatus Eisenbacteria bacterium]|nr:hypothetical protein [Candidatus Eisenbacteria bacterium]
MKRYFPWVMAVVLAIPSMVTMSGCASSRADYAYDYETDGRFTVEPRMRIIPDTDVYYIRDASDYDLYQFEGTWYLNDSGDWYRASSWRGPFARIDVNTIPYEIATVPAGYRRNWVSIDTRYRDRDDYPRDRYASARTFRTKPEMVMISGTSVRYARRADDYDLYRYRGTWFLVEDGTWYRSSSWRGPFITIRVNSVPHEVRTVPSRYRRFWTTD